MAREYRATDWLRYGGLLTWLLAVIPLVFVPTMMDENPPARSEIFAYWFAAVLFIWAYWMVVRHLPARDVLWRRLVFLVLMSIAALAVSWFSGTGIGGLLCIIIAGLLPWQMPARPAMVWVGALVALIGVISRLLPEVSWTQALLVSGMYLGLALFAFMASLVAMRQLEARNALRRVNSELRATQTLLAENTRIAERVRIARELHDLVGHHLTALSLNLEVASHITEGKAHDHVEHARSIARLLLSDVREVVSDMRRDDQVDLAEAIRELAAGVPEPAIHLDLPGELSMTDPRRAQILLRCAQEIITNAVRHAQARNLWIGLRRHGGRLELVARDDGCGTGDLNLGNGLNGMRERMRELGGDMDVKTRPGQGFKLEAWMPMEEAA